MNHGLIAVDGKKLSIPSARVKVGQEISLTERGKRSEYGKILAEEIRSRDVPGWLEIDRAALKASLMPSQP